MLEAVRDRSVATRSSDIAVPSLDDPKLIAVGAEHYAEMCTGCHLAPGLRDTEIRAGLYPKPPNLAEHGEHRAPEETFWIIKHGFKMTGMPAWGLTHDDESIWGMVAFVRRLPDLSPDAYRELVEPDESHDTKKQQAGASGHDHSTHSHDAAAPPPPPAGPRLPPSTVEPVAVVDRFFRALAAGDTKSASAVLDPGVLIFESGGAERSRQEYASRHLAADAAFLKAAKHRLMSRTGDAVGDLAWVATESRLTAQGAKPADVVSTETMVLRKTAEGWRIVHIHWSSRST
ncbi:MAG: c-type cytochrome [Gammaproteobacteria bacterium]